MLDLAAIRARAAAAIPGPWEWRGNVDHDDPRLVGGRVEGVPGRCDVMGHIPVERSADDPEALRYRRFLADTTFDGAHLTEAQLDEQVERDYVTDSWGETVTDPRLAFVDHSTGFYKVARDRVVFEVCRDATERTDPRVYRADIIDVRDPNAQFIAHARQDVDDLLAEVDRLAAQVRELRDIALRQIHVETPLPTDPPKNLGWAEAVAAITDPTS